MKETKKEKVLTIIGVMTLLLFGVGATFAYFVAQDGNAEQTNINVTTHTTDSLVFEVGKAISVTADQTTFAPGAGNRSDNTFARATLKANSSTNSATEHYYVYLNINKNEFDYTTDDFTAELILTVTYKDNEGNVMPITSIEGLTPVTVGDVSGFDITTEQGLITIADNYEITSTGTEVDEWDITLTLVNLDSDQKYNAGCTFNSTLLIQKSKMTIADYVKLSYVDQGINNLYYHNGTILATEETSDYYYNVAIGDILDANDGSYRYAGSYYGVDNWVCFGMDDDTQTYESGWCDDEYLYRIIGVFNEKIIGEDGNPTGKTEQRVKLIKAYEGTEASLGTAPTFDSAPDYIWSGSFSNQSNDWVTSTLNTDVLNGTYLTTLGTNWINKIATTEWKIGGNTYSNISYQLAATAYQNEVVNTYNNKTSNAKVGLMYVSDYAYSASSENWITKVDLYSKISDYNWMYMGDSEWTISPKVNDSDSEIYYHAFLISTSGNISSTTIDNPLAIRPTFYLNSNVTFAGGQGTKRRPYRIA